MQAQDSCYKFLNSEDQTSVWMLYRVSSLYYYSVKIVKNSVS